MFPKPKTENKCMCMFETNKKMCAYKRSYNRAVLQSVFFFRLSDIVTVWRGVHRCIAATLFKAFANK